MSVPFVPNAGQWNARAAFAARTLAGTLFVTTEGKLVYSLPAPGALPAPAASGAANHGRAWSLTETFVSATGHALTVTPGGSQPGAAQVSYFTGGDAKRHRAGIGTYQRVDLGQVFEGVNVQLRATGANVEKIFTVAPRQDPRQIHVKLEGALSLEVGDQGELIAHTGNGPVTYTAPIAFQEEAGGARRDVAVRYALDAARHTYSFALGDYDSSLPLVIDPLLKSVYLGGTGEDYANAMVVHPHTGYVYVAGFTSSTSNDFPGVAGGFDATFNGGAIDAFVSRLSPDLTQLLASTYFGGSLNEAAAAIAVHPDTGEIYIAGNTASTSLPSGLTSPAQPGSGGGAFDAFVARFSADLTTLQTATFLGGSGDEFAYGIAIHPFTGEVYVVGETNASPTNNFPVGVGAAQTAYGGNRDAFVTRFSADLSTRTQSTFLGGTQFEFARAIAIHAGTGDVFVAGDTNSGSFPGIAAGSAQSILNGANDAFVTRLNRGLTSVIASTYLGAGSTDLVQAVVVHPLSGEVIVSGYSNASVSGAAFPGMSGAPQAANAGAKDAFVSRLDTALTSVLKSTYLGSIGDEEARGLAVSGDTGEIYIAGFTNSAPFTTPATVGEAYQATHVSATDMYVARYRADLAERLQVTYLGTNANEYGNALAIHPMGGSVLVAGYTSASTFPGVTPGSPTSHGGGTDAVVSMFTPDLTAYNTIPAAFSFAPQGSVATTQVSGPFPNTARSSNEARMVITPTPPINVQAYVTGSPGSEVCATNTAGCCTNHPAACAGFVSGWVSAPYRFLSGDYIAVRHTTPIPVGVAVTRLIVGGVATAFVSSSGDATIPCNLDGNGDNILGALNEGLLLARAMGDLTGTAVTVGTGITTPWVTLRNQFNSNCGTNFR